MLEHPSALEDTIAESCNILPKVAKGPRTSTPSLEDTIDNVSNLSFSQEPGAKLRWERDPFGPDHYLEVNAILRPPKPKLAPAGTGQNAPT